MKTISLSKKSFLLVLLMTLSLLLCSCLVETAKENKKFEKAKADFEASVQDKCLEYFSEISDSAGVVKPSRLTVSMQHVSIDDLNGTVVDIGNYLTCANPRMKIGLSKEEGQYSDKEIHDILMELKKQKKIVDIYFNGSDRYCYQVADDGSIKIDITDARDGGAMHRIKDYEYNDEEDRTRLY